MVGLNALYVVDIHLEVLEHTFLEWRTAVHGRGNAPLRNWILSLKLKDVKVSTMIKVHKLVDTKSCKVGDMFRNLEGENFVGAEWAMGSCLLLPRVGK